MEKWRRTSSNYGSGPPWVFRGSALYQFHLVKSEIARAFIPKELKLVEAFGYTLGGIFLAHYNNSPAGMFDELVLIPGIVWNPPTSCAWAGRVLVSNQEACTHGRKEIGLPSQVAMFSKRSNKIINKPLNQSSGSSKSIHELELGSIFDNHDSIEITELVGSTEAVFCNISLSSSALESNSNNKWTGPKIRMSLPSYSGKTKHNHNLLKYSCQIQCRVQKVETTKITCSNAAANQAGHFEDQKSESDIDISTEWNRCISVLLSKPILALKFNMLKMEVHAPSVVIPHISEKLDSKKDSTS
ncbi:Acetoacetate decarboxylase [Zostera marina]|uniref:Acetoacetate decarboxylase n=1 Tax=Zostera marina TaxID=29655 RepID=A0A0K9PCV0_ZOSMR|nr:Acetoacetate decarboxylase [Zostera marina]